MSRQYSADELKAIGCTTCATAVYSQPHPDSATCKQCLAKYDRQWRIDHKDEIIQASRQAAEEYAEVNLLWAERQKTLRAQFEAGHAPTEPLKIGDVFIKHWTGAPYEEYVKGQVIMTHAHGMCTYLPPDGLSDYGHGVRGRVVRDETFLEIRIVRR